MTKKEIDLISSRAKGIKDKIYYDELGNRYIGLVNGRIVRDTSSDITTGTITQIAKQVANSGTTTPVSTSIALDDLTDVTLTSPTSNDYLVYNGTDWVNQPSPAGTVTSVGLSAGTGISVGGTNPVTSSGTITVTNTAPDQTVVLTGGTGISISGTYPSFTINNTSTNGKVLSGTATQVSGGVYTTTITGVTAYTAGDLYLIKFTTANDGASTLNINSLGAINIYKNTNVPIASGDIKDNQEVEVIYDGTNFQAIGLVSTQLLAYVHNAEGSIITKGQVVYAYQASGNKMSVKLAKADSDTTSAKTVGLVYDSSIGVGGSGYIIIQGVIEGVNTAAFSAGDTLYLSPTTAGQATNVKPYAPSHMVYVGIVERANAGNGQIYVRCQNGYELDEIHDVDLISTAPVNNDILTYVTGANNLWKPRSISTILGYTPQQQITLTTTGTSGPATLTSGTLNIPQYSGGGGGASQNIIYSITSTF